MDDDDATPLMNDGGRMAGIIISVIKNGSGRNTREYIGEGGGADRDNIIHNTLLGVSIPTTARPVISLEQGNRTGRDV